MSHRTVRSLPDIGTEPVEQPADRESCLVCQEPSEDLICEACRARIRSEALEQEPEEPRTRRG